MEKVKELFNTMVEYVKNNKKQVGIVAGVLVVVILVTVVGINIANSNKVSQEEKLSATLEELGKDFYEKFYYPQVGSDDSSRATFLEKFSEIGIKVNLDNLSRYNGENVEEKVAEFKNEETGEECDKENTKVTIYPKAPYGSSDYTIEVKLICGFEEK
ncbi:MAG: hypothetical protein ACI4WW_02010 [Candidatus Coprovivens sp.]